MSSVLCEAWQRQVQDFFTSLHGHQSKTLAWFVLGAIRAKSVVLPQIAEALLAESEAKASSIERRLERFLSNPRIDVKEAWEELLTQVMPFFKRGQYGSLLMSRHMKSMRKLFTWDYYSIHVFYHSYGKSCQGSKNGIKGSGTV
jgi:hypothetical protein